MKNYNSKSTIFNLKSFAKYFFAIFSIFVLAFGGMAVISLSQDSQDSKGYYSSSVAS